LTERSKKRKPNLPNKLQEREASPQRAKSRRRLTKRAMGLTILPPSLQQRRQRLRKARLLEPKQGLAIQRLRSH